MPTDHGDYLAMGAVTLLVGAIGAAQAVNGRYRLPFGSRSVLPELEPGVYLGRPQAARRKILNRCIKDHGFRRCLESLLVLERDAAITKRFGSQLASDHRYLVKEHGQSVEGSRAVFAAMQASPGYAAARDALVDVLAVLRSLQWDAHTGHWVVQGPTSYSDHLLLERIYAGEGDEEGSDVVQGQIDRLGERIVAYYGRDAVKTQDVMRRSLGYVERWSSIGCPLRRALMAEEDLQVAIRRAYDQGKESGFLSLGLDDELMALANAHDTNRYLLRQRIMAPHDCVDGLCQGIRGQR